MTKSIHYGSQQIEILSDHTNIIASYKFLGLFSISFKTRSANLEYLIELSHRNLMFVDPSIIESLLELVIF